MRVVNMHEAKTSLSKLVAAVESGAEDEIVIARNGKPVVRLVVAAPKREGVRIGLAKGRFELPDDFEQLSRELDSEIESLFYGERSDIVE